MYLKRTDGLYWKMLILLGLACIEARAQLPPDFPAVTVTTCDTNAVGEGYIFLEVADASATSGAYVMILQNDGTPVWYQNLADQNFDFKVLPNGYLHYADIYHGHSWTDGGDCTHEILDGNQESEETVAAGNGYAADAHDFQLLPNGHVLLDSYYLTRIDLGQYVGGGYPNALLGGAVIQELDASRNVVFQWRSWDHFSVPGYFPATAFTNATLKAPLVDAFHLTSVVMDNDGNLLVSNSGLDVWKIDRGTGRILWRLGGPANQFSFVGEDPQVAIGHFSGNNLSRLDNGDILVYCNADQSAMRGSEVYEYRLDETNKVAALVWSYVPRTNYRAWHYGSAQRLPNGNTFIGWGAADPAPGTSGLTNQWIPACTEVASNGAVVFEMRFDDPQVTSYRAYRFPYPPSSQAKVASVYEPADGNTYSFDSTGVSLNILGGGGGYTEVTVTREPYAPVNPQFPGTAPQVIPVRTSLKSSGIYELDAEVDFDVVSFSLSNPDKLTVYYRTNSGQGVFLPQPTAYNPLTHRLVVNMTMFSPYDDLGEFAFGYPDVVQLPHPPILAAVRNDTGMPPLDTMGSLPAPPGGSYQVNDQIPVRLEWSPEGLAASFHLQVASTSDFSTPVVDLPAMTTAFFTWSNAAPNRQYYFRVNASNDGGTSDWSQGAFKTVPPGLTVTVPNGGEAWERGKAYFIQWNDNTEGAVSIDLYKGGAFLESVATNASAGAYLWLVSPGLLPGDDYSIRVSSTGDSNLTDMSDTPFRLDAPRLTEIRQQPDGAWVLSWSGSSSRVFVEFSPTLDPVQWQSIAGPLTGSTWTNSLPMAEKGFYRLRLE